MMDSLPTHYGYVVLSATFTGLALQITTTLAGLKRAGSGVAYPNLYASDITAAKEPKALDFNNAQRGALNPHEGYPATLACLLLGGLAHPLPAAALGVAWGVGAIGYYAGYSRGPEHRYSRGGGIMRIASLGLLGLSIYTGVALVRK